MVRIRPFASIRPLPNKAAEVASVPYDVVTTDEARRLSEGNPHSFLHVVRSEIDLPDATGPHDPAVYARAKANLDRLLADGILVREDEPKMYLYRQVMNHRSQIGLVCCCHLDDYANDVIKKHERTRPDKEDDRTRHILTVGAQTGPVLMAYRAGPQTESLVEHEVNARPLFHFNAPDGVTHSVWTVEDPQPFIESLDGIDVYIADGHHRVASAARVAAEKRAADPGHEGDEEYDWLLAVLVPVDQLTILPYHRMVADLNGHSPRQVLDRLAEVGALTETNRPQPERTGVVGFYLDERWHRLEIDPASLGSTDPIETLEVARLQRLILEPIFGIGDPRTDARLDFVGGNQGIEEIERRVKAGVAACGFALYPTTVEQLLAAADARRAMPPKSTWFEPKLRSGLFVHSVD